MFAHESWSCFQEVEGTGQVVFKSQSWKRKGPEGESCSYNSHYNSLSGMLQGKGVEHRSAVLHCSRSGVVESRYSWGHGLDRVIAKLVNLSWSSIAWELRPSITYNTLLLLFQGKGGKYLKRRVKEYRWMETGGKEYTRGPTRERG